MHLGLALGFGVSGFRWASLVLLSTSACGSPSLGFSLMVIPSLTCTTRENDAAFGIVVVVNVRGVSLEDHL